jgi:hypothetical protein
MYIFDPLHPVVLDENKIRCVCGGARAVVRVRVSNQKCSHEVLLTRFYLCTTEGVEERSTFAFSMNVMFCIGTLPSHLHLNKTVFLKNI